jgi:hypothetical protein
MNCFYKINDWYSYLQTNFKAQDETAGGHPFTTKPENRVAWYTLAGYITKNLAVDPESRANYKELAKFARYKTNVDDARDRNNISIVEELYQKDNWDNFIAKIHEIAKAGFAERRASVLSINKYFFYWLYHDSDAEISIRDVKNYADEENNFFAFVKMGGGAGGKGSKKKGKAPDLNVYEKMMETVTNLLATRRGILQEELSKINKKSSPYDTFTQKLINGHLKTLKIPNLININLSSDTKPKKIEYPDYTKEISKVKDLNTAQTFIHYIKTSQREIEHKIAYYNKNDAVKKLYEDIKKENDDNIKKIQDAFNSYKSVMKKVSPVSADQNLALTEFKNVLNKNKINEYEINGITWYFHEYYVASNEKDISVLTKKLTKSLDKKFDDKTSDLKKKITELSKPADDDPAIIDTTTKSEAEDTSSEAEEEQSKDIIQDAEDRLPLIITPPKAILSDNDKSFISKISELAMSILEKFNNNDSEELIREYGHLHQLIKNYINELRGNILDTKKPDKTIYLKKLSSNIDNVDLEHIYTQLSLKLWPNEAEPGTLVRDLIEYCIDNDPVITLIASVNEFYYNFESKKGMLVWSRPNRSVGSHHADFFGNVLILKSETVKGVGEFDINESDYKPVLTKFKDIKSIKIKTGITKIIQKGAGMRTKWNGIGGIGGAGGSRISDEDLTEMTLVEFIEIYTDYFKDIENNSSVLLYEMHRMLRVLQKNYYVKEYAEGLKLLRILFKKHKTLPIIFNGDNATVEQKLRLSTMMNAGIPDNYCIRKKTLFEDAMEYLHLSRIKKKTQEWEDYGLLNYLIGTEKYDVVKISSEFEMRDHGSIPVSYTHLRAHET